MGAVVSLLKRVLVRKEPVRQHLLQNDSLVTLDGCTMNLERFHRYEKV